MKNKFYAVCHMVKYTACAGRACANKKEVKCVSVCHAKGWNPTKRGHKAKCSSSFCKGFYRTRSGKKIPYSSVICKRATIMQ